MNFNNDDDIIISYSFSIMKMSRNPSKFSLGWKNSTSIINLFPHICTIDNFFQQILTFEENSIVAFYGAKGILWNDSLTKTYFDKWWGNKNQLCLGKTIDFRTLVP